MSRHCWIEARESFFVLRSITFLHQDVTPNARKMPTQHFHTLTYLHCGAGGNAIGYSPR